MKKIKQSRRTKLNQAVSKPKKSNPYPFTDEISANAYTPDCLLTREQFMDCVTWRRLFPKPGRHILIRLIDKGLTEQALEIIKTMPELIREKDRRRRTPLIAALTTGNRPVIEALLTAYTTTASPIDKDGNSARSIAEHGYPEYIPAIDALLRYEADNIPIKSGIHALQLVSTQRISVRKGVLWCVLNNRQKAVKTLLEAYPDANLAMSDGELSMESLARVCCRGALPFLRAWEEAYQKRHNFLSPFKKG